MNVLLIVGIILLVLWLLGFLVLPAIGWLINVLLVIALVLLDYLAAAQGI